MTRTLEICAASLPSALAAQAGGAHRIELCQNLEQGGITPSYGLIRAVREQLRIPVFVLIRPRPGGFVYSSDELEIMREDIRMCRKLGCDGVVLGVLTSAGKVSRTPCRFLIAAARSMEVTFHRAFDSCPDQAEALEEIIRMGCQRVLTSGGQATAVAGQNQLAALVTQATGRIAIMPGAGVSAANIRALANHTGATEFHTSAKRLVPANPADGLFQAERFETDATLVAELVEAARTL
jgi:copper homeostasis protein